MRLVTEYTTASVPQLNLDVLPRQYLNTYSSAGQNYTYYDAGIEIPKVAMLTASSGAIRSINAPFENCSYTLNFFGPSLRCNDISLSDPVWVNWPPNFNENLTLAYYASAPLSNGSLQSQLLDLTMNGTAPGPNNGRSQYYAALDRFSEWGANLHVLLPAPSQGTAFFTSQYTCTLFNTSYTANFTFKGKTQAIDILQELPMHAVSFHADLRNTSMYQNIFYQAIMEAVGNLVTGFLTIPRQTDGVPPDPVGSTNVLYTPLLYSSEMSDWRNGHTIDNDVHFVKNTPVFIPTLRELFRNVSLGLFGSNIFLNQDLAETKVPVTKQNYQNVYHYVAQNLVIVYTVCIFVTCVGNFFGLYCMLSSGQVYENSFSTALRVTRNPEFDRLIDIRDTVGACPLPGYLAESKVVLRAREVDRQRGARVCLPGDEKS